MIAIWFRKAYYSAIVSDMGSLKLRNEIQGNYLKLREIA